MKVKKLTENSIYTNMVQVTMSEAELMFIRGLAAIAARSDLDTATARTGTRLAKGSDFYWNLGLDYDKLFVEREE